MYFASVAQVSDSYATKNSLMHLLDKGLSHTEHLNLIMMHPIRAIMLLHSHTNGAYREGCRSVNGRQNQPLWMGTQDWIMTSECSSRLDLKRKKDQTRSYRKCISAVCIPGLGNCACLVQIPPSSHGNNAEEANITHPPMSSHCPLPKMLSLTSAIAAPFHQVLKRLFLLSKKRVKWQRWWRKPCWNAPCDGCCSLGIARGAGPRGAGWMCELEEAAVLSWCPPGRSGSSRMRQEFLPGETWDQPQPCLPAAETLPVNTTRVQGFPWYRKMP